MANTARYIVLLKDLFSGTAKKIAASSKTMTRSFAITSASLKKLGYHFTSLRNIIAATYGAAMIAFPIKQAIDWESKMIDIQRVMDFKPGGFEALENKLKAISLHLGEDIQEIATLAYEGAKLSDTADGLDEFVTIASRAAKAFDMTGKEAGELLGSIRTKLSLTNKETGAFLDTVNYLGDNIATTGKKTSMAVSRMLSEVKQFKKAGLPPQLVAGWAAFADSVSTTPRLAASGMKMMIGEMSRSRKWGKKLRIDAHAAMTEVLEYYGKKPKKIDKDFSVSAGRFVKLASTSMDAYKKVFGLIESGKDVGSMLRELNKKLKSAETAVGRMKVMWQLVSEEIGKVFLPIIKNVSPHIVEIAQSFKVWAKEHPKIIKVVMAIVAVATALSALTVVIGLFSIAIGTLISIPVLVIAAIAGLIAWLIYLKKNNAEASKAFDDLWIALQPLIKIFRTVAGLIAIVGAKILSLEARFATSVVIYFAEKIAKDLKQANHDISAFIDMLISLVDYVMSIPSGIFNFFNDLATDFGRGADEFAKSIGKNVQASVAAEFSNKTSTNITGGITVSAEKGTRVKDTWIKGLQGMNNVGLNMGE